MKFINTTKLKGFSLTLMLLSLLCLVGAEKAMAKSKTGTSASAKDKKAKDKKAKSSSTKGKKGKAPAKGKKGKAPAKGKKGKAPAKGKKEKASAKGKKGKASAKGKKEKASAKGKKEKAPAKGKKEKASAKGKKEKAPAKGKKDLSKDIDVSVKSVTKTITDAAKGFDKTSTTNYKDVNKFIDKANAELVRAVESAKKQKLNTSSGKAPSLAVLFDAINNSKRGMLHELDKETVLGKAPFYGGTSSYLSDAQLADLKKDLTTFRNHIDAYVKALVSVPKKAVGYTDGMAHLDLFIKNFKKAGASSATGSKGIDDSIVSVVKLVDQAKKDLGGMRTTNAKDVINILDKLNAGVVKATSAVGESKLAKIDAPNLKALFDAINDSKSGMFVALDKEVVVEPTKGLHAYLDASNFATVKHALGVFQKNIEAYVKAIAKDPKKALGYIDGMRQMSSFVGKFKKEAAKLAAEKIKKQTLLDNAKKKLDEFKKEEDQAKKDTDAKKKEAATNKKEAQAKAAQSKKDLQAKIKEAQDQIDTLEGAAKTKASERIKTLNDLLKKNETKTSKLIKKFDKVLNKKRVNKKRG